MIFPAISTRIIPSVYLSGWIVSINRIIPTVRKHIVPQEALTGAGVAVRVEEAAKGGVVISALEVVEARLRIAVVAIGAKMSLFQANIESGKCCLEAADL